MFKGVIVITCCFVVPSRCRVCSWRSIFFFKQKTAYGMRISDWSSDVCSSDLAAVNQAQLNLDYTRVTAPVSGRMGRHEVSVGNLVMGEIGRASCRERVCQYV